MIVKEPGNSAGPTTTANETGCRPTFINVGPGRCATSWLLEVLQAHPEVEMSRVKETEYFNTHFDRDTAWYENHFAKRSGSAEPAIGEISSNYYLDENVPARINAYDSSTKLIINLRNPYTLMESFYGFGIRRGMELPPLEQALDIPVGKLMGSGYDARERKNALTISDSKTLLESVCLFDRLKPFHDLIDSDRIHYFVFEKLQYDYRHVLAGLFEFLSVDPDFVPDGADKIVNSSVQPKSIILARMATGTAAVLRRVGAYGLLSRLHRSELIKKVLFKQDDAATGKPTDHSRMPESVQRMLDDQIEKMKSVHPPLKELW